MFVLMLDFDRESYEGGPRVSVHETREELLGELAFEIESELESDRYRDTDVALYHLHGLRGLTEFTSAESVRTVLAAADAFFAHLYEREKRPRGDFWSAYHPSLGYRSDIFPEAEEARTCPSD